MLYLPNAARGLPNPNSTWEREGIGLLYNLAIRPFSQRYVHKLEFDPTEQLLDFSARSKKLFIEPQLSALITGVFTHHLIVFTLTVCKLEFKPLRKTEVSGITECLIL